MKTIILAEKPSVAKEYARALNCPKKSKGYFEGQDYIVSWALGHLVTLATPQDYDPKYKEWRMEDLPMLPDKLRLKVIKKTSHQFRTIRDLIKRKDVKNFIIATDAGREGELVARWIMILGGWKGPFRRLWISSQTQKAILEGFSNLRDGRNYNNLFLAAAGRAEADWMIGLNVTRALTCKYNAQLSAGRVQTPTLAIIIQREEKIKNFKPQDFWRLEARFNGLVGEWRDPQGNTRIFDQARAQGLLDRLKGQGGIIMNLVKESKKQPSPPAFDLTELQREANTRYNYSAKKTLSILQVLYERHRLVTYPRTDSRYITSDMLGTLPERLRGMAVSPYDQTVQTLLKWGQKPGKGLVNDKLVTDHHAIIPTEEKLDLAKLTSDEKKIYDLIARRFLMVLSPPYQYEQIVVTTLIGGEKFYSKVKIEQVKGWKAVRGSSETDDTPSISPDLLSHVRKGQKITVTDLQLKKSKTTPPARYTEATLLTAMEFPGKFIKDKQLLESIQGYGLGTPATRADIIEKLVNSDYIFRESRHLVPTPKGYQLLDLVPEDLKSPELTARWELNLKGISEGKKSKGEFISQITQKTQQLVKTVKNDQKTYKPYNQTTHKCPVCTNYMLLIKGARGNSLKCSDLKCGYIQTESNNEFLGKKGHRDRRRDKGLINRFSDHKKKTSEASIGSLFEDALKKKD